MYLREGFSLKQRYYWKNNCPCGHSSHAVPSLSSGRKATEFLRVWHVDSLPGGTMRARWSCRSRVVGGRQATRGSCGREGKAFLPKQPVWPVPPVPTWWLLLDYQRADGETEAQNAESSCLLTIPSQTWWGPDRGPASSLGPPSPFEASLLSLGPSLSEACAPQRLHGRGPGLGHHPQLPGCT